MMVEGRKEREFFWRNVLERQQESGLSVAGYCRQESLSAASFYAWRRKFTERDGAASDEHDHTITAASTRLLPVRIAASPSATTVRILLPQGVSIDAPSNIDPRALIDLLGALREAQRC